MNVNVNGSNTTPQFVIQGEWLAEWTDEHTCGTGRDGYFGMHEPGCGLIPVCTLAELPAVLTAGFAALASGHEVDA